MKLFTQYLTLALFFMSPFSFAAEPSAPPSAPQKLSPAIENYGGVVNLPDAAVPLDPKRTYKLVFNITQLGRGETAPLEGLETAARFINLAALAGVPKENLKIVMAIHGAATPHALSNAKYQEKYGKANPSLELINKLSAYGVKVYVCGQALAGFGFEHAWVAKDIDVAVAALTVLATYQLDGYALMSY